MFACHHPHHGRPKTTAFSLRKQVQSYIASHTPSHGRIQQDQCNTNPASPDPRATSTPSPPSSMHRQGVWDQGAPYTRLCLVKIDVNGVLVTITFHRLQDHAHIVKQSIGGYEPTSPPPESSSQHSSINITNPLSITGIPTSVQTYPHPERFTSVLIFTSRRVNIRKHPSTALRDSSQRLLQCLQWQWTITRTNQTKNTLSLSHNG